MIFAEESIKMSGILQVHLFLMRCSKRRYLLLIEKAQKQRPYHRQNGRVTPMVPLSLPVCPTDKPINICYRADRNRDPTDRLWMTEEKSGEQGHAHEHISRTVDHHQAVYQVPLRGRSRYLELEEAQRMVGTHEGIDSESDGDGGEGTGHEAKHGGIRGRHFCAISC